MDNELKRLVLQLGGYGEEGWEILKAIKQEDGSWDLTVKKLDEAQMVVEAKDDN